MKKPMLNAIQKARMSMAMKSKNPKMNPGFESLPKEVQMKIMKSKKPKMAMMKKPMLSKKKQGFRPSQAGAKAMAEARKKNVKVKPVNKEAVAKRKAIIAKVRKEGEAKVSAQVRDKNKRIGGRSVMRDPLPPRMSKKKNVKMAMKKPAMMGKKPKISTKVNKKTGKALKKIDQAEKALANDKVGKAMRKYKSATRKAVKGQLISKEDRKKLIKDARANKPMLSKTKVVSKKKVARKKKAIDRKKSMVRNIAREVISGKRTGKKAVRALKDSARKQRAMYKKQKKINDFSQ